MSDDLLPISSVDQAPSAPGIYACYARIILTRGDWAENTLFSSSPGVERLFTALNAFSQKLRTESLAVQARLAFSQNWSGEIASSEIEMSQARLEECRTVLAVEKNRMVLADILSNAVPWFAAPIYIGVAENLRRRLKQHRNTLLKLRQAISDQEDEAFETDEGSFARRAFSSGLSEDEIAVRYTTLTPVSSDLTTPLLRKLYEIAEWHLNRWYVPSLGKR
jgi:hypothetical protein